MSLNFDSNYYHESYGNSKFTAHFNARAQWIIDRYGDNSFNGEIWIIGAGWGHVVKAARDLLPAGQKSRVKGIVFSQYEKDQSINVVGLPDGAIEVIDAQNKVYPDMDVCVSWNFLDSILPDNEAKATGIVNKLINKAKFQTHIICMSNDPDAQSYIDQGYNIQSRAYWRDKFNAVNVDSGQHCVLVNYATGVNSRKTPTGWTIATGLNIPLLWDRVSN